MRRLGGIRGVLHYMQRTAVQGSPRTLAAVTGRWVRGARDDHRGDHPFRKHLDELAIGDTVRSPAAATVTLDDIERFAALSGDTFYAHMTRRRPPQPALRRPRRARLLLISPAAGLFVDPAPGPVLANYGLDNLRFLNPSSPATASRSAHRARRSHARQTEDYGEVRWDADRANQNDELVATYDVLTLVAKRES